MNNGLQRIERSRFGDPAGLLVFSILAFMLVFALATLPQVRPNSTTRGSIFHSKRLVSIISLAVANA
jgi:hypothetical protein